MRQVRWRRRHRVVELLEAPDEVRAGAIELQAIAGRGRLALKLGPPGGGRGLGLGRQALDVLLIALDAGVQVGGVLVAVDRRLADGRRRLGGQRGRLGSGDVKGALEDRDGGLPVLAEIGEARAAVDGLHRHARLLIPGERLVQRGEHAIGVERGRRVGHRRGRRGKGTERQDQAGDDRERPPPESEPVPQERCQRTGGASLGTFR